MMVGDELQETAGRREGKMGGRDGGVRRLLGFIVWDSKARRRPEMNCRHIPDWIRTRNGTDAGEILRQLLQYDGSVREPEADDVFGNLMTNHFPHKDIFTLFQSYKSFQMFWRVKTSQA